MRSSNHGPNLTQLTSLPRLLPVNTYLVREAAGLTLVDAGLPGGAGAILAAAEAIGLPITRIVLTHAHSDHVGSLEQLRLLLPTAEIAISARDARFLAGDRSLDPAEPQAKLRGGYPRVKLTPDRLLADGDRVGSLQVVAAPGHTPGHIALFDTRDGSLIAGDAFQVAGGLAVAGTFRWRFPLPALATWHHPTALASARRLLALNPSRLAVGHGAVLEQPQAALAAVIAEAAALLGPEEARSHGA